MTKQWALSFAGILIAVGLGSRDAQASFLQAPQIGGRDGGLAGNVVAAPSDGGSILLFNPAGVVGRPGTEVMASPPALDALIVPAGSHTSTR